MSSFLCYFSLSCATSTIASASLNDFFNALTSWIISSVQWLLTSVLTVLDATSDPSTIVNAATSEYANLTSLAPLLLVLGLLVATLQALLHFRCTRLSEATGADPAVRHYGERSEHHP